MNFKDYSLIYRLENLMNYLWFLNELLSMLIKICIIKIRILQKNQSNF